MECEAEEKIVEQTVSDLPKYDIIEKCNLNYDVVQ